MNWWPIAIRAGDYKLIAADAKSPVALYDLRNDPLEARDLGASMIVSRASHRPQHTIGIVRGARILQ